MPAARHGWLAAKQNALYALAGRPLNLGKLAHPEIIRVHSCALSIAIYVRQLF